MSEYEKDQFILSTQYILVLTCLLGLFSIMTTLLRKLCFSKHDKYRFGTKKKFAHFKKTQKGRKNCVQMNLRTEPKTTVKFI